MYYPYFITYLVVGLFLSGAALWWALKNGQFKDQQRARFLALEDERGTAPATVSKLSRYEIYGLFMLALAGLSASAAVLVYALFFQNNGLPGEIATCVFLNY